MVGFAFFVGSVAVFVFVFRFGFFDGFVCICDTGERLVFSCWFGCRFRSRCRLSIQFTCGVCFVCDVSVDGDQHVVYLFGVGGAQGLVLFPAVSDEDGDCAETGADFELGLVVGWGFSV